MGDRYGNKNSGIQSFLLEAIQHGAKIVENCRVDRVITTASASSASGRRATGVECTIVSEGSGGKKLVVNARQTVILAAGALHTPCVLQKSGFCNPHIGRHLRLHPVTGILGFSGQGDPIDPILGAPMTTVCNEFVRGPKDNGYGAKIETPCAYPGILAAASPWISPSVYKDRMLRYRHCVPLIVLQRDSGDGGSVRVAKNGSEVIVDYTLGKADKESMMHALQGGAKILVAANSVEIGTGHIKDQGFQPNSTDVDDGAAKDYVDSIASRGMKDHEVGVFSAHQMGTCRMTSSPSTGAVDPNGETWECDDLFVMDTSLFPTASGSNPMVTVLTLSYLLSTRLDLMLQLRNSTVANGTITESNAEEETNGKKTSKLEAFDRVKAQELSQTRQAWRAQQCKKRGTIPFWSVGAWLAAGLAVLSGCFVHATRLSDKSTA
jgi:GMC oxidoreductase